MDTYTIKEVSEMFHLPSLLRRSWHPYKRRTQQIRPTCLYTGTYQPSEDHLLL